MVDFLKMEMGKFHDTITQFRIYSLYMNLVSKSVLDEIFRLKFHILRDDLILITYFLIRD